MSNPFDESASSVIMMDDFLAETRRAREDEVEASLAWPRLVRQNPTGFPSKGKTNASSQIQRRNRASTSVNWEGTVKWLLLRHS